MAITAIPTNLLGTANLIGRESVLITGLEGSGKSHYLMSQIKQILANPDFKNTIYIANVEGITIVDPRLKIVDKDFNWLTASENDIVIYDEAGTIDRYSNNHTKLHTEELQMISQRRKTGILLVFVAQDSQMINSSVRKLLKFHFHFSNPYNDEEKTHCFVFTGVKSLLSNDNKSWHGQATEEFTHVLDPEIFPLYKSINDNASHNKVKQTNKKARRMFIVAGVGVLLAIPLLILAIYMGYSYYKNNLNAKAVQAKVDKASGVTVVSATANTAQSVTSAVVGMPISAVANTNQATDMALQQSNAQAQRQLDLYNQRLPQDYQIYANNQDLNISGAIKMGNTCKAYNANGEYLNVSQKECLHVLAHAGNMIKNRQGGLTVINQTPVMPSSAIASTSAPASTYVPVTGGGREYAFNADNSHERVFN